MKIDKITICNLTSLEGEQIIDFTKEPLRSAGLFAITGDTGAGKSTVLDAICLALYNRAPRFDNVERFQGDSWKKNEDRAQAIQANDVRNILRRGCREGYCRVEFTATDGARYEAGWSLSLKRTGTYNSVTRSLRQLAPRRETVPEKEVAARLPEIIGLDYTQFTRTVMLAQNSFANFLRARRDEKSALLEKLTGTEIYGRISQKINELAGQARRTVEDLENIVQGILHDRLQPDELQSLSEERTLLTASAEGSARRSELISRQLRWYADFDAASAQVRAREAESAAAHKQYVAVRSDELLLERYDSLLAVQPLYQQIVMRQADVEELKRQEDDTTARISAGEEALRQTAARLDSARERVADAERQAAQRRPVISRGHALTGEISEVEGQLRKADEQVARAQASLDEQHSRLLAKRGQAERTHQELEQHQLHQQALSVHRLMFDKFDLVKDKLSVLTAETRRNQELHKRFAELQKKQSDLAATTGSLEKKQQADEAQMASLKSELLIHRQTNQGHDSLALQQRFADNRNRLLGLERAQALWARISSGYEAIEEKHAGLKRLEMEQEQTRKDLERAALEAKASEEAYGRLNVALTLSQSENIVQLRRQLKEGTACPVCGATHHPYHTETERELGELLTNLGKEFKEISEELQSRRDRLAALQRQLAAGEGQLRAERQNLADREERGRADAEEWKACAGLDPSFAECSPSVNRDARRLTIGLLIDNTQRAVDEARTDLETFNYHQQHINRLNEAINALDSQMSDDHAYLDSLRTQYQIASASAADTERAMQLSDRSCSELYTDLDEMVTLSGWFTEWKNSPDNFRLRLTALYRDWQQTTRELDGCTRSEALLREEVKAAEHNENEARRRAVQAAEARDAAAETLANKRQELVRLFGEGSPEKEEEALQTALDKARAAEAQARAAHDDAAGRLQLLQGTLRNLADSRDAKLKEFRSRTEELDQWILRYNGTHPPVQFAELDALFSDRRDWKTLRDRIHGLREAVALAASRLDAARQTLLSLQGAPDRPSEQDGETRPRLQAEAERLRAEAERLHERLGQISLRLMAHEACERKAAAYDGPLAEARADRDEWKRLDTLFGSADGKKFREVAQQYTFHFLVDHANYQLRQLSPRYRLRAVPDSLTLEIIDHDMFDQHRYVCSLSGGETFVVSLALALGLASLSAEGLSIGSLFIDEGFGNLDHDSLELVMTALSNLENTQGRKVGVISHTEQIRSQISPQVRLVKLPAGGRSRIEIG